MKSSRNSVSCAIFDHVGYSEFCKKDAIIGVYNKMPHEFLLRIFIRNRSYVVENPTKDIDKIDAVMIGARWVAPVTIKVLLRSGTIKEVCHDKYIFTREPKRPKAV